MQNNTPPPDHALMAVIGQRQDARAAEAFALLADRHMSKALGYVTRLLNGDKAAAEDIVQEGFIRVWQHAATWEPHAQFSTWFYTALYRLCVDHWRKNKRIMTELDETLEDGAPDPEMHYLIHERQRTAHDALAHLPASQRHALMMFHSLGLNQNEVAAAMKISVGAVESLLFRGRRQLKAMLQQQDASSPILAQSKKGKTI